MPKTFGSHLRRNVVGYIALFVALGGTSYAATGGNFILGKPNSASSTTSLSAPVAGKTLQLTNTSTGAGATGLGISVASGHSPLTVNSGTKVANLNADKLDGVDSTGFLPSSSVKRLEYFAVTSGSTAHTDLATVGPYTIVGQCQRLGLTGDMIVRIYARGPAGTADSMWNETRDDNTDLGAKSNGLLIPASSDYQILFIVGGSGHYVRGAGTLMLRSGSATVQVDFNAVADSRNNPGSCFIYGTAMRAT